MTRSPFNLIIRRVLLESNLFATRFLLGLAELIWAVSLLLPCDTFSRTAYFNMASLLNEYEWAALFMLTAVLQFSIIGMRVIPRTFSTVFSFFNMCFWWFVVLSVYTSIPAPAAISGDTALAIGASIVFIKAGWGDASGN